MICNKNKSDCIHNFNGICRLLKEVYPIGKKCEWYKKQGTQHEKRKK